MKVLIAVGGGGHFSPALAVIEQMPKDWEVVLVGRKFTFEGDTALSLEYRTAKRLGLQFETITTGRLQRKFTQHTLSSLMKIPVGILQAKKILSRCKPDVILSFGGYVSVPVVLAAAASRVPIVIHEQTLHAGLANKLAARFATKICISWEQSAEFFPKEKIVLTGNPLRKEFINVAEENIGIKKTANSLPLIYVTGGSGGAHGINLLIEGSLEKLLEKFQLFLQTGDAMEFGDYDRLEKIKSELQDLLQKNYKAEKFVVPEKVSGIMRLADLVISRSGINTVTELLYLGKPCLLIPLPYGQHNEQLANAEFVKKIGLAEIVDQLVTAPDDLFDKVSMMVAHLDQYEKNKSEAKKLIHPDAAERIINEVQKILNL